MEKKQSYVVRFESKDGEVVAAELRKIGAEGEKSFKKISDEAVRTDARMDLLTRTVMSKLIPSLSAIGLGRAIQSTIKSLGDLKDAAEKVQISAEKLQVFRIIGEDAGINEPEVDAALSNYVKKIGEAQEGVGKLLPVLKYYNIALKDANGQNRTWEEILRDIATVIQRTDSAQEQMFIAGKAGLDGFLNALRKGPEEMDKIEAAARENGRVIDEYLIQQADKFDKEWARVADSFEKQMKAKIVSVIQAFSDFFKTIAGNNPLENDLTRIDQRIEELNRRRESGNILVNNRVNRFFDDAEIEKLSRRRAEIRSSPEYLATREIFGPPVPPPSGGSFKDWMDSESEGESARKKTEQVIKQLIERNKQLEIGSTFQAAYNDALGHSNKEMELSNQLFQAGVTLQSEQGQQIAAAIDKWYDLTEATRKNKEEVQRLIQAADNIGDAFGSAFEKAVFEAEDFGDVLNGLLNDISRSLFRTFVSDPLSDAVSDLFKGLFEDIPLRDSGGPVTAGSPYRVGVPELFVPANTGQAIPLHDLKFGRGGSDVQVNVHNYGSADNVKVRETKTAGGTSIDVVIDKVVGDKINQSSSNINRALRQFGKTPLKSQ